MNGPRTPDGSRFERATAAAVRAIAGHGEVTVEFDDARSAGEAAQAHVRLGTIEDSPGADEIMRVRGDADAAALRLRHHDAELHRRGRPADEAARLVFDALEEMRFEMLGARFMPGVAANLARRLDARCRDGERDAALHSPQARTALAFALRLRREITGSSWPGHAERAVQAETRKLDPAVVEGIRRLARTVDDQGRYAVLARRLLVTAGLLGGGSEAGDPMAATDTGDGRPGTAPQDDTSGDERAGQAESASTAVRPDTEPASDEPGLPATTRSAGVQPLAAATAGEGSRDAPGQAGDTRAYRAFTTEHDVVLTPEDLCDRRQLAQWRRCLDREMAPWRTAMARLTTRLQQRLVARQEEGWDFELEEGLLDTERLAGRIAAPYAAPVYKLPRPSDFPDTVLCLLIDCSGSMRGLPIRLAAMCADLVALALEHCSIRVEILGFTTREWRGGRSREQWIQAGMPPHPGRLNDLCHLVCKAADVPWRRARNGLGIMLDETLLKENIDGEALLWAYGRLRARAERRRILLVLSDGAPADSATAATNTPDYLDRHLRQVIRHIERENAVELAAIGLCHDVGDYYRRQATTLDDPLELGEAIVGCLDSLLR